MRFRFLSIFVFILIGNFNASVFCADNDVLKVFSEGYKKNRESFTNISCKFRVTANLQSETSVQATKGILQKTSETTSQDGIWFVKDGSVRFELKCSTDNKIIVDKMNKEIQKKPLKQGEEKVTNVPCLDTFVMSSKDSFRLTYSDIMKVANIIPKGVEEGGVGVECSPFDMGIMARNEYSNPYRYLQDCINGRFTGRYEGTEEINGQRLEIVTFSTKTSGNQPRMKFGFDPKKGFLATYIADYNENTHKPNYEAFILETKKCSGDRFFPIKSVVVSFFRPDGKLSVRSIVVTDLDVDTPLDPNLFRFEIPVGAQVSVPSFKDQWLTVEEPLSIVPQDIEQLQKNCIEYAKAYIRKYTTPPGLEPNLRRGNWLRVICILLGLLLIGMGGRNLIRRWQTKK
jgi:hypothetical protein